MKILFKKIFSLTLVSILIFLTGCGKNPIKLINKEKPVSNLEFVEFDFGASTNVLKDIDFSGSDLSYTVFTNMTLENINFSGAIIDNINFSNSTIISSTFESNSFGTVNWTDASLDSIDFSGNDLSGVSFIGLKSLKNSKFVGIGVNGTNTLESPSLKNVRFENINLISGVDFSLSNLENASFSNIDTFEDINFKSKAVEIDLRKDWPKKGDVISGKIVPIRTSLKNVEFSNIKEFKNVDFSASDLTGSTFENIESINSSTFASIQKKATDGSGSLGLTEGKTTVIRTLLDNCSFINTPINSCNFRAASFIGTKFDNVDIYDSGFPAATYEYLTFEQTYYLNPIFKNTILHKFSMKDSFIEPNENEAFYDFDVNEAEIHLSESGRDGAYKLWLKGNDLKIIGKNLEKRTESKTLLKSLRGSINNINFDNLTFGVEEISKTEKVNKYSSRTVTTRTDLNTLEQGFKFSGNIIFDDVSFNSGRTNKDRQNGAIFIKSSPNSNINFINSSLYPEMRVKNNINELKITDSKGSISIPETEIKSLIVSNSIGINLSSSNSIIEDIDILDSSIALSIQNSEINNFKVIDSSSVELSSKINKIGSLVISSNKYFKLTSSEDLFDEEEMLFSDNSKLDISIVEKGIANPFISDKKELEQYTKDNDLRNARGRRYSFYSEFDVELAKRHIIEHQMQKSFSNSNEGSTPNLKFLDGGDLSLFADPKNLVISNYNNVSIFCGSNLSDVELFDIKDASLESIISDKSFENLFQKNVSFMPGPNNLLFGKWNDEDYWKPLLEDVKSKISTLSSLESEIEKTARSIDENYGHNALTLTDNFKMDDMVSMRDMTDSKNGTFYPGNYFPKYEKVINDLKTQKALTEEEIEFVDLYGGGKAYRKKITDKHESLKQLAIEKTDYTWRSIDELRPKLTNYEQSYKFESYKLKNLETFEVLKSDYNKDLIYTFLNAYEEIEKDFLAKQLVIEEKSNITKNIFKDECDKIIRITKKINAPAVEQNNRINAAIEPFAKEYAKFIYESNADTFALVLMFSNEERATRGIITGDNSYLTAGMKRVLDTLEARIFNRIKSFMTKEMDNFEINIIVLEALTEWLEMDPKLSNEEIFVNLISERGLDPQADYGRTVADELPTMVYDIVEQSMRDLQR